MVPLDKHDVLVPRVLVVYLLAVMRPDEVVTPGCHEKRRDEGTIGVHNGTKIAHVEPRRLRNAPSYHAEN